MRSRLIHDLAAEMRGTETRRCALHAPPFDQRDCRVAEIFFTDACLIHCWRSPPRLSPVSCRCSSCLPEVEEETAKILPWPLAAAYGTESKYDVNKMEAFVVLAPSSFSSSQTIALVTRALIKTLLLHIPTIQYLYTVAQACRERASID